MTEVTFVQMAIKAKLEYSRIFQTQGLVGMEADWSSDRLESLTPVVRGEMGHLRRRWGRDGLGQDVVRDEFC